MSATADIPLRNARGEVVAYARVDAVDAHLGEAHRWYHHASGYVVRAVGSHRGKKKRGLVYLHRAILGLADGDSRQGDHVDLNRLNNRRANLRIVTTAEQAQNKAAHGQGNGKSPYRAHAVLHELAHDMCYNVDVSERGKGEGMSKRTKEREQFLADIIVGAVEGGCSYWARSVAYRWSDEAPATTRVLLIDMEEEDKFDVEFNARADSLGRKLSFADVIELEYCHAVTIDTVAKGLGKIKRNEVKLNSTLKKEILLGDSENDGGYIDADGADVIVQAAIFGEVVYG